MREHRSHRLQAIARPLVILLGIACFWPGILGYDGWKWSVALLFVLAALIAVTISQIRRFNRNCETAVADDGLRNHERNENHDAVD
jgi:uncharacterized membrane protein